MYPDQGHTRGAEQHRLRSKAWERCLRSKAWGTLPSEQGVGHAALGAKSIATHTLGGTGWGGETAECVPLELLQIPPATAQREIEHTPCKHQTSTSCVNRDVLCQPRLRVPLMASCATHGSYWPQWQGPAMLCRRGQGLRPGARCMLAYWPQSIVTRLPAALSSDFSTATPLTTYM